MSPQRLIRTASRRPRAGARALLWPAAATSLPVVVAGLVLIAATLAVLVARGHGFGHLASTVAVEWLITVHAPLTIDSISLGFLPLLPTAIFVAVLALRTRSALAVVDESGPGPLVSAVCGTVFAPLAATVLACVVVQSSQSDFAVRATSVPSALAWTLAVGVVAAAPGAWAHHRVTVRERLPLWSVAGVHLGIAALMATFALGALLTTVSLLASWGPVGNSLGTGKDFWGIAALALISVAYLPNLAVLGATAAVGAEFHLGEASYSVFATAPGPLPEVPLAAALPVANPHWGFQVLLLLPALAGVLLARATAHWFATPGDGVRACLTGGAVAAVLTAASSEVAGGTIGVLGSAGSAVPVAAGLVFLEFGVLGALTSALSLAGLTRRRNAERERLERRRQRVGATSAAGSGAGTASAPGSGIGAPEVTGPESIPTGSTGTDAARPGVDATESTEPESAERDETEPGDTEPDETERDEIEPDDGEPDDSEPDATEPDDTEPDATEPDDGKPENSEQSTPTGGPGLRLVRESPEPAPEPEPGTTTDGEPQPGPASDPEAARAPRREDPSDRGGADH